MKWRIVIGSLVGTALAIGLFTSVILGSIDDIQDEWLLETLATEEHSPVAMASPALTRQQLQQIRVIRSDAGTDWIVADQQALAGESKHLFSGSQIKIDSASGVITTGDEKIAWAVRPDFVGPEGWLVFRTYPTTLGKIWGSVSVPLVIASVIVFWLVFWSSISIANLVERTRAQNKLLRVRTRDLAQARDGEREANQAKSMFLANISHEIRTPLNAILGLSDIGYSESKDSDARKTFSSILAAGEHLLDLINDVLDFSKIEAGKLQIDLRAINLHMSVRSFVSMVTARAEEKNLSLTLDLAPDLPTWIRADPLRLRQIVLNLLSNAVKFTDSGGISLSVTRTGASIEFSVTDSGIGMNSEEIARLFVPFEQVDSSTTRRFGGTGLGLKISRDLARMMDGDISVKSVKGAGTTFVLTLPLLEASEPVIQAREVGDTSRQLAGLRFLAAEDVSINRMILEKILQREGAEVVFVENGQEAVSMVKQTGAQQFDAVLMDVQMPVMDGYEATRQILSMKPRLPVIGLTAHALDEEKDKCLDAGMVAHVTKPLDTKKLTSMLARLLQNAPAPDLKQSVAAGTAPTSHV